MNGRVVVAGVLGGIAVFIWGMVTHMALTLGEVGVARVPDQDTVLPVLAEHVKENKVYVFPWYEDDAKTAQAYTTSPHGILVFTPADGSPFGFGRALGVQAATSVLGGILVAFLFASSGAALAGWSKRIAFGAVVGGFATLEVDVPYWNWYGFPADYLASRFVMSIVGWSLGVLIIGWWLGRKA